jgi:hydroxylaminobenzene mutase
MTPKRRLVFLGLLLFLASMLTGFAIPAFTNPRGALSAHLAAGMGGLLLIGVGVAWDEIHLSERLSRAALWLTVYGTWGNWAWNCLNAAFGTHVATPIAGAGHTGAPDWQEKLILVLLGTSVLSITSAIALLAAGARGETAKAASPATR